VDLAVAPSPSSPLPSTTSSAVVAAVGDETGVVNSQDLPQLEDLNNLIVLNAPGEDNAQPAAAPADNPQSLDPHEAFESSLNPLRTIRTQRLPQDYFSLGIGGGSSVAIAACLSSGCQ